MKRIFYATGSIVTGDRTAEAVLAYAEALSQRETSDTITIPVMNSDGTQGEAELLIGPASQLMAVTELPLGRNVDDEDTLLSIERRIEGLLRPEAQPFDDDDLTQQSGLAG